MEDNPRPRHCKGVNEVPVRSDFIQVLWELDNIRRCPLTWCSAEVLHVDSESRAEGVLASGVIRYSPTESWDGVVNVVEFLPDHLLRCKDEESLEAEQGGGCSGNENPCLCWRYVRPEGTEAQKDDSDDDWNFATLQVPANKGDNKRPFPAQDTQITELKRLRRSNASLLVEFERQKRTIKEHENRLYVLESSLSSQDACTSVGCALTRLRHRLAQKIQAPLRQIQAGYINKSGKGVHVEPETAAEPIDGLMRGVLKARVECNLQQFERLAREIRSRYDSPTPVQFRPEFEFTQKPSPCAATFVIAFATLADLCDHIGLYSTADRLEMLRKCGSGPNGDLLRMLGTYCFDERDPIAPSWVVVGGSSVNEYKEIGTDEIVDEVPHETQEMTSPASGFPSARSGEEKHKSYIPVLTRCSREWVASDCRYAHPLKLQYGLLSSFWSIRPEIEENAPNAFMLIWRRSSDIGSRTWSKSLCRPDLVLGWLEVSLPFVQTSGVVLCTELGGLATDKVLAEVVLSAGDGCSKKVCL